MRTKRSGPDTLCLGITKQTILAVIFVSLIPSSMDIFVKITLDKFSLPFLSIVVDASLLFLFTIIAFLYTQCLCPSKSKSKSSNIRSSPFWITSLFSNLRSRGHLKCIILTVLLATFWSGNCIFTYLATLCDVPSFVGMLKGFVSPLLVLASCLFGGKEPLTFFKIISVITFSFGEILINLGEVTFNGDCLLLASIAVICTTGKYFMIEKVMNCKLSRSFKYDFIDVSLDEDSDLDGHYETHQLLGPDPDLMGTEMEMETNDVDIGSLGNVEMVHLRHLDRDYVFDIEVAGEDLNDSLLRKQRNTDNTTNIAMDIEKYNEQIRALQGDEMVDIALSNDDDEDGDTENTESEIDYDHHSESMPAPLTFGYILPLQIVIGVVVFMQKEYEEVMHRPESDNYIAARDPWFWISRLIVNAVMACVYYSEIFLVAEFSSLYMMVFGTLRNVTTLVLSWIVLHYKLTLYGWIGYGIAICSVCGFQYARSFDPT